MRFMPMGRPIKPSPIKPIFLLPADDSKGGLLELAGAMQACAFSQEKEDTIVAESQLESRAGNLSNRSGGLGAMCEGKNTGGAAGGSGGRRAERLILKIGSERSFGRGLGSRSHRGAVRGGPGLWFFPDAHQILIRDFPAEMSMLAALLEILFEENGTAGIGHESPGGRQK